MHRRILLLITDLEIGGTPTVVRELAVRLHDPPGVQVQVACLSKWGPVATQLRESGIAVAAFDAKGVLQARRVTRDLVHLIRREQFDTVVSFLIHANAIAAEASKSCPQVRFIQSIQTTQPRPKWHWLLQRFVHHAADKVVVPSQSVARFAARRSSILELKFVVIPNAVDPAQFESIDHPPETARPFPIGFLGRLDPIKRVPDLIDAAAILRGLVHLHIFGEGQQRAVLEALIRRHQLTDLVTMHGAVEQPETALAQIGALVLPSDAEGFGLVLIEAMAAGVPVIGTRVDGIVDVVRDGETGLLTPARNPGKLAAAIEIIVRDARVRQRFIQAAKEDVRQRFTWEVVLPQYRQLLRL